jgi:hypothetical protein
MTITFAGPLRAARTLVRLGFIIITIECVGFTCPVAVFWHTSPIPLGISTATHDISPILGEGTVFLFVLISCYVFIDVLQPTNLHVSAPRMHGLKLIVYTV